MLKLDFRGVILVVSAMILTGCNDPVSGYFAPMAKTSLPSPGPSGEASPAPVVTNAPGGPGSNPIQPPQPTPSPTHTVSPTPSPSASPSHSPSPSPSASASPSPSASASASPSASPSISPSPSASPMPSPSPSPSIIGCNPFSTPSGSPSSSPQIDASLYYLSTDPGSTNGNSVQYYIQNGNYVGDFLFSQVDIPTENFMNGLPMWNGKQVTDKSGNVLLQWFALDFKTSIKLGPNDEPGLYEFAVLSDDGSIMYIDNGMGLGLQPEIENDGEHSNRIVCSSTTFNFSAGPSAANPTVMPMELKYYQGPQYSIAAQIFWRKVSGSKSSLSDPECVIPSTSSNPQAGSGDDYYYDTTNNSAIQSPMIEFLNRGWSVLAPDNFVLPSGVAGNCTMASPSPSPSVNANIVALPNSKLGQLPNPRATGSSPF